MRRAFGELGEICICRGCSSRCDMVDMEVSLYSVVLMMLLTMTMEGDNQQYCVIENNMLKLNIARTYESTFT